MHYFYQRNTADSLKIENNLYFLPKKESKILYVIATGQHLVLQTVYTDSVYAR